MDAKQRQAVQALKSKEEYSPSPSIIRILEVVPKRKVRSPNRHAIFKDVDFKSLAHHYKSLGDIAERFPDLEGITWSPITLIKRSKNLVMAE